MHEARTADEIEASIVSTHRRICNLQADLLVDIAAQDLLGTWQQHGAKSEEDHLANTLGLQWRTAKTWVRLGHALAAHPDIAARYAAGAMSTDQLTSVVDALAVKFPRIVQPPGPFDDAVPAPGPADAPGLPDAPDASDAPDPSDALDPSDTPDPSGTPDFSGTSGDAAADAAAAAEATAAAEAATAAAAVDELLDLADRLTPAQLASVAARLRRRSREEAASAHRRRHVNAFCDTANSRLHLDADLFDGAAATVWAALMDFAHRTQSDLKHGSFEPLPAQFADALEAFAAAYLEGRSQHSNRPTLIVHADARIFAGEDSWAETTTYAPLASETIRRMACHCDFVMCADDRQGNPLYLGRRTQTPSWRQVDACRRRDGGCRFPGCGRALWTQCHHIREWVKHLGKTDYDNLCTLCTRHHHLVHEGGWTITGNACATITFTSPDGRITLTSSPNDIHRPAPPPPSSGEPGRRPDLQGEVAPDPQATPPDDPPLSAERSCGPAPSASGPRIPSGRSPDATVGPAGTPVQQSLMGV